MTALVARSIPPTTCPFSTFRQSDREEVVYLPPLLSLLPVDHSSIHAASSNDNKENDRSTRRTIGFTDSRLPFIDDASVELHRALHKFEAVGPDYARLPYDRAFNWSSLELPEHVEREWYIVAFRSKRKPGSPNRDLYEADRAAHEEAVLHGGLLMYWFGVPNVEGENLATCIWTSRQAALEALKGDKHRIAMQLAAGMYEHYRLERYALRKAPGTTSVRIEGWSEK